MLEIWNLLKSLQKKSGSILTTPPLSFFLSQLFLVLIRYWLLRTFAEFELHLDASAVVLKLATVA